MPPWAFQIKESPLYLIYVGQGLKQGQLCAFVYIYFGWIMVCYWESDKHCWFKNPNPHLQQITDLLKPLSSY